jgi:cation transport regulator ChaC
LLDRGHLRFFDRQGVDELIRQSGLRAETTLRVIRRLDQTEFDIDLTNIPDDLRTSLENDIDALTYQFFIIARPARALQSVKTGTSLLEQQRERIDQLAAELEKGCAYSRHVEKELAAKDGHLRELERWVEDAARTLAAKDVRIAEIEQVMADMTRLSDDTTAYVQHLEGELQKRAGDLAIRDDEMSMLRVHIERAERVIAERDALLQAAGEREALLHSAERDHEALLQAANRERDALLEMASRTARENRELTAHFAWVLQQPRHRLAEWAANTLRRSPRLHRALRPIVLAALKGSPTSPGSPSPWP